MTSERSLSSWATERLRARKPSELLLDGVAIAEGLLLARYVLEVMRLRKNNTAN